MVHLVLFVAVGAGTQAEATPELVGLRVTHWAVVVRDVTASSTIWMTLQALRAYLNESLGTSTNWRDTHKIPLGVTLLAI